MIEITDEMNAAGLKADGEFHRSAADRVDCVFRAMLDAVPKSGPWNGEGLPPTGELIELRQLNEDEWRMGKVVGIDCGQPVVRNDRGYVLAYDWRKLLTEEEREAQEREKAIAEIHAIICHNDNAAEALYEKGFRFNEAYQAQGDSV